MCVCVCVGGGGGGGGERICSQPCASMGKLNTNKQASVLGNYLKWLLKTGACSVHAN